VIRSQVLHQDKGHTWLLIDRHAREKRLESGQPSGRGTDADDGKISGYFLVRLGHCAPFTGSFDPLLGLAPPGESAGNALSFFRDAIAASPLSEFPSTNLIFILNQGALQHMNALTRQPQTREKLTLSLANSSSTPLPRDGGTLGRMKANVSAVT
jgi:hypothetical protein